LTQNRGERSRRPERSHVERDDGSDIGLSISTDLKPLDGLTEARQKTPSGSRRGLHARDLPRRKRALAGSPPPPPPPRSAD